VNPFTTETFPLQATADSLSLLLGLVSVRRHIILESVLVIPFSIRLPRHFTISKTLTVGTEFRCSPYVDLACEYRNTHRTIAKQP